MKPNTTYRGVLTKVYDNTTKSGKQNWSLFVNADETGFIKFSLWDKKYAGIDSENNAALCDVHDMVGQRVVLEAKAGSPKDDDPDDCWPSTVELISLEEAAPTKSVREMAEEIEAREAAKQQESDPDGKDVEDTAEPKEDALSESRIVRNLEDLNRLSRDLINAMASWIGEIKRLLEEVEVR